MFLNSTDQNVASIKTEHVDSGMFVNATMSTFRSSSSRPACEEPDARCPLRAAELSESLCEEPGVPIEHLRTIRQLRRHRESDADQLGSEVRARRRRRDHLVVRAGASARSHHSELRDDTRRRSHSVLACGRRSGARARLPLHHAAEPRRTPARRAGSGSTRRDRAPRARAIRSTASSAIA